MSGIAISSSGHFVTQGNVTASGNISSSSDIIANNLILSGDFTSTAATAQFTNITASGEISASGNIIGNNANFQNYNIKGESFAEYNATADALGIAQATNMKTIDIGKPGNNANILLDGSVTASGNISSSGYVMANSGSFALQVNAPTGSFGRLKGLDGNAHISFNDPDEADPGMSFIINGINVFHLGTAIRSIVFNEEQGVDSDFIYKSAKDAATTVRFNSEDGTVGIGQNPGGSYQPSASLSVHGHISASGFVVAQGFVNKFLENNVAAAGSGQGDATVIGTNLYQRGTQNIFVEGSDAAKGVRLPSIQTISKQYSASIQGANHGPGTGWNGQDGGNATGLTYQIVNTSDEALKVYPSNAQKILPLSANAPVVIPGYNKCEFLLSGSGDHGSWWPFFTSGSTSNVV